MLVPKRMILMSWSFLANHKSALSVDPSMNKLLFWAVFVSENQKQSDTSVVLMNDSYECFFSESQEQRANSVDPSPNK